MPRVRGFGDRSFVRRKLNARSLGGVAGMGGDPQRVGLARSGNALRLVRHPASLGR
jgi:hypothetical protein